jgi:hypothetical protein
MEFYLEDLICGMKRALLEAFGTIRADVLVFEMTLPFVFHSELGSKVLLDREEVNSADSVRLGQITLHYSMGSKMKVVVRRCLNA